MQNVKQKGIIEWHLAPALVVVDTSIMIHSGLRPDDSLPRLCKGKSLLRESADKQQRLMKLVVKEKAHNWFETIWIGASFMHFLIEDISV